MGFCKPIELLIALLLLLMELTFVLLRMLLLLIFDRLLLRGLTTVGFTGWFIGLESDSLLLDLFFS